jgi:predicted small secreted protein/outer membrane murein-binding lipoprotein Lpp
MRSLCACLLALVALAGCNTAAGMKQDTHDASVYTYERKEEYQRALASEMRELDVKIDELKVKAGRASDSVKAEFAKDMDTLDRQKAVLAQKMEAVKTSSAAGWNDVKAGANSAMDSVKQTYEKAKAKLP